MIRNPVVGIGELVLVAGIGAVSGVCKLPLPSVTSTPCGTSHAARGFEWRRESLVPTTDPPNPSDPPEYLILL